MISEITHTTVLVEDTDEALEWYTTNFGFEVRTDEEFAPDMRWVIVAPENGGTEIVLQEPNEAFHGEERAAEMVTRIGEGTTTVVAVDDCRKTVSKLESQGVEITTPLEEVPWGIHANVIDLYGNPYNLVENR